MSEEILTASTENEETVLENPVDETAANEAVVSDEKAEEAEAPAETMADYEDAITASMKPIHEGDIHLRLLPRPQRPLRHHHRSF